MNLSGNTILITGGGSGIGKALAEQFHALDNQVIITGRRKAALDETTAAHPGMRSYVLDVEDPAAIHALAAQVATDFPKLNVIVNNAGIMKAENLQAQPDDLADAVAIVTTNLLGPIRLTQAFLPQLKRQPRATIMTVSSGLAFVPLTMTPTYNATKAAIHSYSQSLRAQLHGTGIDVIELVPPGVQTDLLPGQKQNPEMLPLADYIRETMAILKAQPDAHEILVERVKFLRNAEAEGRYPQTFAALNRVRH